jgi:hypothetical protein
MRRLVALGALSLVASSLGVACGDDDGDGGGGGRAGTGGSAGASGSAGSGGSAGTGGSAGAGGSAGSGGAGGTAGTGGAGGSGTGGTGGNSNGDPDAGDGGPGQLTDAGDGGAPPCTGCIELRMPVTGANENTLFTVILPAAVDMSDTLITFRVKLSPINDQVAVLPGANDDGNDDGTFTFVNTFVQANEANGFDSDTPDEFVDVEFDVGALAPPGEIAVDGGTIPDPADFNNSEVLILHMELSALGAFVGPATITLLIDSITFTNVDPILRPSFEFTTSAEGWAVNTGSDPNPGSDLIHHPE